jgi:hypothetical protein
MHDKTQSKFVEDRPFAKPEAAAQELLQIYRQFMARRPNDGHTYTGVTNREFIVVRGGSVAEYSAGVTYGIEQQWFRIDGGGTRVYVMDGT